MTERWLPVAGFEGLYSVSNLGRVKSHPRHTPTCHGSKRWHSGGVMSPVPDRDGYPKVLLRIEGRYVTRRLHRLVCEAFNGPPSTLRREVHHIDRDRANARADNLQWVSRGENMSQRCFSSGGERNGFAKLTESDALEILGSPNVAGRALAEKFGVTRGTIYDIRQRRSWKHL